ncbi:hypothetical protein [Streptomyces sp. NPDC001927]
MSGPFLGPEPALGVQQRLQAALLAERAGLLSELRTADCELP